MKDLTGRQYGWLTVLREYTADPERRKRERQQLWLCRCACGSETVVSSNKLVSRNTQSCGCRPKGRKKSNYSVLKGTDGLVDPDFDN